MDAYMYECWVTCMGIYACVYVQNTYSTHTYVVMDEFIYTCMYVYVYIPYGCIHFGMYFGRHMSLYVYA